MRNKRAIKYVKEKHYDNIKLTGAYNLCDIENFVRDTDFVLNMYENDKQQKPAMTVKFYDAIKYSLPMLVTEGSYMGNIVDKYDIGVTVDLNNESSKEDVNKLLSYNFGSIKHNSAEVRKIIQSDDEKFFNRTISFVRGNV